VDNAQVVKCLDGAAELNRPAERGDNIESLRGEDLVETPPPSDLHDHEGLAVFSQTKLQHSDERGMSRRCLDNRPTSAPERLHGTGHAGGSLGQEPYRDLVIGRLVIGQAHGPEGARSQLADDPVAALHA
jgi:hypothetical protein